MRFPDPRADGQRLAGISRRDGVLVGLKRNQRAARRDSVNHDLGREREHRQWPQLVAHFPDNTIVRMVSSITTLTSPELVADVQSFFAEHPIPQSAKTLEQLLERQRVNAHLRAREAASLAAALEGSG